MNERVASHVVFSELTNKRWVGAEFHLALTCHCVLIGIIELALALKRVANFCRYAVFRRGLPHLHKIILHGVAGPQIPVFKLVHILREAAVSFEQTTMKQHRLNRHEIVVP